MPVPHALDRRAFLSATLQAALGTSLLAPLGCSRDTPAATGDPVWHPTSIIAELEDSLPRLMAETRVPGLSIALIRRGRIAWRRGFGVADVAAKTPVTVDTLFEAQSMSKAVFAYAVMKLRERGLLDLDTPLTAYLPDRILQGDPRLDKITARHVLSHTSGLPNWRSPQEPLAIHFTPGERFEYSGEGYWYLESVVTHLTGGRIQSDTCNTYEAGLKVCATDFEELMQTQLLRPFDMRNSAYVWHPGLEGRLARPHDAQGAPLAPRRATAIDAARYASAGGLLTTPTDYAKFLLEVIEPKPVDAWRLTRASRDEMVRPVVKVPDDTLAGSWALGWRTYPIANGTAMAISHAGGNTGAHCFAAASITHKCGFVVMTNGEGGLRILFETLLADAWRERILGS